VNTSDAVALIARAMPENPGSVWADFGAGAGTFTRALTELLGPESRVYAVDRDAAAIARIGKWPSALRGNVIPVVADLTGEFELPGLGENRLDGALFANTLHFIREPEIALSRLVSIVKPGGRVVFIEYDRRAASPWVPYPISSVRLPELAASSGLTRPTITTTRHSEYGGELYVAASDVADYGFTTTS
jgi:ubiquinone/menaquinone biosynthesis C-methylase UbiE